jgi:hypothetical protein
MFNVSSPITAQGETPNVDYLHSPRDHTNVFGSKVSHFC